MEKHYCNCYIVPPNILEKMKNDNIITNEVYQRSSEISLNVISARKKISEQLNGFLPTNPKGTAQRFIYDSKNTAKEHFELVRQEHDAAIADDTANQVFDNCGRVRDFFNQEYNFFSVDNNGKNMVMNIHYEDTFLNALWSTKIDQMIFGDGDGVTLGNFAAALDVIAHELTHGIVEYTSGLIYTGQSGALNEHLADVFGTVVKQHYKNQNAATADWLIGDTIVGANWPGKAVRSMSAPGTAFNGDPQPDHMSHYNNAPDDNFGVHTNSGILNKVFYLVANGIPPKNDGTSKKDAVAGLDTPLAGRLWFESLKNIKSPNCDFRGFYEVVMQTTQTLMHENVITRVDALDFIKLAFGEVGIS